MKTLKEIYENLKDLGALTKASYLKAAKAQGHDKEDAEAFWAKAQPAKVKRPSLAGAVREAILANPNLTDSEIIMELDTLGGDFGRLSNPSWAQARSYFQDQWEIARAVFLKYSHEVASESESEDQIFEDLGDGPDLGETMG